MTLEDFEKNVVYFCEYSTKQNCFHIAEIHDAMDSNRFGIIHGHGLDFIPFAITDDFKKANDLCDQMKKLIRKGEATHVSSDGESSDDGQPDEEV